jgi:hypothetical protein
MTSSCNISFYSFIFMQKKQSRKYFEDLVRESLVFFAPNAWPSLTSKHYSVDTFDSLFAQLWHFYKYRTRYNLYWCFTEARTVLQDALTHVFEIYYTPQFHRLYQRVQRSSEWDYASLITNEYNALRTVLEIKKKKYRRLWIILAITSGIILLLDIMVSVLFVIMITYLSNSIKIHYTWYREVFVIIFFASFIKITLDKFFVTPLVLSRWWYTYRQNLESIKKTLAQFEALGIVLRYDLDHQSDLIIILRTFHTNLLKIQ